MLNNIIKCYCVDHLALCNNDLIQFSYAKYGVLSDIKIRARFNELGESKPPA